MLHIDIPGREPLNLEYLVLDFNGTLARNGIIKRRVRARLKKLSKDLSVHVVTADTFGKAAQQLKHCPVTLNIISGTSQAEEKAQFVSWLGREKVCAVGNGYNDHKMVRSAGLGIAVIQEEGAASMTVSHAPVVCISITHALDLLLHCDRLRATLRT